MPDDNHNDLRIGELPELRILPVEDIILHEEPDIERVAHLVERLGADGVLKNPPVVAVRNDTTKRVLLDGANRMTALKKLDLSHVLVQEIDYADERLVLDRWHHAIEHLCSEELMTHTRSIPGVSLVAEDDDSMSAAQFVCRLRFANGDAYLLQGAANLSERIGQLQTFTHIYHHRSTMDRVSYTDMEHLRRNYRGFTVLVTFPRFTKEELSVITDGGVLLPSGITRVLLPKRALRFNLHLDILRSRLSVEEKNDWLREAIQQKIVDKNIRFYREPTFFFDE